MTRRFIIAGGLAGVVVAAAGCSTATPVPEQAAKVGCGLCRFRMEGSRSCFWAIELDGEHYPVVGANQPDHESHAPDGMCVIDREAVVAGRIERGQFLATKFELRPAENVDMSKPPPPHEH